MGLCFNIKNKQISYLQNLRTFSNKKKKKGGEGGRGGGLWETVQKINKWIKSLKEALNWEEFAEKYEVLYREKERICRFHIHALTHPHFSMWKKKLTQINHHKYANIKIYHMIMMMKIEIRRWIFRQRG